MESFVTEPTYEVKAMGPHQVFGGDHYYKVYNSAGNLLFFITYNVSLDNWTAWEVYITATTANSFDKARSHKTIHKIKAGGLERIHEDSVDTQVYNYRFHDAAVLAVLNYVQEHTQAELRHTVKVEDSSWDDLFGS